MIRVITIYIYCVYILYIRVYIYIHVYIIYYYAQTPRFAHTPSMLYTWGYQTLDFTFNWEDQQGYLGNINFPPPLNFTFIEDLQ